MPGHFGARRAMTLSVLSFTLKEGAVTIHVTGIDGEPVSQDMVVPNDRPTLTGYIINPAASVAGAKVIFYADGVEDGSTLTQADGTFSYAYTASLAFGLRSVSATVEAPRAASSPVSIRVPRNETIAYLNAVRARGYSPDNKFERDIDNLVSALIDSGAFANYDVLLPTVVPDARAEICLVSLRTLILEGSPVPAFTPDGGHTGGGNGALRFSPDYNPGAGGQKFSQNDAHLGAFVLTLNGSTVYQFGASTTGTARVRVRAGTDSAVVVNAGGGLAATGSSATVPAHIVGLRRNAETQAIARNGVELTSEARASSAVASSVFRVFRTNSGDYSAATVAFVHAGRAHTAPQLAAEDAAMRTYLAARGVTL